jgi:hypothetical protein
MMSVVPSPTTVTVLPEIVATAGLLLVYTTSSVELDIAFRSNGRSPTALAAIAKKVMV